jgi:hypothetical protein
MYRKPEKNFTVFPTKQIPGPARFPGEGVYMRTDRKLETDCWYDTSTKVNNGERLFGVKDNVKQFEQVVNEAQFLFEFEIRGLKFNGAEVLFYIKPVKGLELPEIMQWIKQTFAVRFNRDHGRTGHIWGDRYKSEVLPGEPPPDAEVYVFDVAVYCANRRARRAQRARAAGGGVGKNAATGQPARGVGVCP